MAEVALVIRRRDGETWRQAALRLARKYGMEEEVAASFDEYRREGSSAEDAAWCACYDWDVIDEVMLEEVIRRRPRASA